MLHGLRRELQPAHGFGVRDAFGHEREDLDPSCGQLRRMRARGWLVPEWDALRASSPATGGAQWPRPAAHRATGTRQALAGELVPGHWRATHAPLRRDTRVPTSSRGALPVPAELERERLRRVGNPASRPSRAHTPLPSVRSPMALWKRIKAIVQKRSRSFTSEKNDRYRRRWASRATSIPRGQASEG